MNVVAFSQTYCSNNFELFQLLIPHTSHRFLEMAAKVVIAVFLKHASSSTSTDISQMWCYGLTNSKYEVTDQQQQKINNKANDKTNMKGLIKINLEIMIKQEFVDTLCFFNKVSAL